MRDAKNIKIFLNYCLGPVLFAWLAWSIFRQIQHQPDLHSAWIKIREAIAEGSAWKFWLAFLLMGLNWSIEAVKWMNTLSSLETLGFPRALKAVLAGLAFAVNTPNRIGEYGGRVLYLPEGKRLQAVSLTLIGSFSQLLVTLLMGTAGLGMLYAGVLNLRPGADWQLYHKWMIIICPVLATICLLLLLVYLRLGWLLGWLKQKKILGSRGAAWLNAEPLPVRILLRVLGWSLLRYVVFVFQYILLLDIFEVSRDSWTAWWMISILYLVLTILPTIALAELGIRGKLALVVFSWISSNQLGIITATITLWLVNLVLPAVLGSILMLRIKIFRMRLPQEK